VKFIVCKIYFTTVLFGSIKPPTVGSRYSSSNQNERRLIAQARVRLQCACALANPWGSHHNWNEALHCFARRRPQLTRDPVAIAIADRSVINLSAPAACTRNRKSVF
jgi:hypothetical protein